MKKIVFVALMAIVFAACSQSTKNDLTICNVGGVEIILPKPGKAFKSIDASKLSNDFNYIKLGNNILCVFIDSSEFIKSNDKSYNINELITYAFIMIDKDKEKTDCTSEYFKKYIDDIVNDNNRLILDIFKKENPDSNDIKNFIANSKGEGVFPICNLFNTNNSYGMLSLNMGREGNEYSSSIIVLNAFRIRNRMLVVMIFKKYESYNTIKWLTNTSEAWAKAILDANK